MKTDLRDGAALAYAVHGPPDAPAVVLLNSLGCTMSMWDGQMTALGDDFRVVRFDNRGHGRSAVPVGPYRMQDLVGDTVAVLDAAGIQRAHVIGSSLGGVVALSLALASPGRVDRLVVANSAARVGTAEGWQQRADTVRSAGMRAVADTIVGRFFSDEFRTGRPDIAAAFRAALERMDPAGYAGCCDALRDADLRDDVGHVRAPTLVIAGAHDVATPVSDGEYLATRIADCELRVLDAAHLAGVERPHAFNDAARHFLTQ